MIGGNRARVARHLAAILAADIAGYGRLMGEDEEGTLAALRVWRREIADPRIKEDRSTSPQADLKAKARWSSPSASSRRGSS